MLVTIWYSWLFFVIFLGTFWYAWYFGNFWQFWVLLNSFGQFWVQTTSKQCYSLSAAGAKANVCPMFCARLSPVLESFQSLQCSSSRVKSLVFCVVSTVLRVRCYLHLRWYYFSCFYSMSIRPQAKTFTLVCDPQRICSGSRILPSKPRLFPHHPKHNDDSGQMTINDDDKRWCYPQRMKFRTKV